MWTHADRFFRSRLFSRGIFSLRIGITELILIFIVALVVIGPDKLPQYAKKLGEALAQFRKASDDAASEIKKSVVEPLEEAQKPLREAMEPIEELDHALKGNVRDVQKSIRNIGRTGAKKDSAPAPAEAQEEEEKEPQESQAPDTEAAEAAPEGQTASDQSEYIQPAEAPETER